MRKVHASFLTAGLIVLAASPAFAQPPGGRFGRFQPNAYMLLGQDKVQEELKLTDDQKDQVKKVREKYQEDIRSAFGNMDFQKGQELMKKASDEDAKALKPEQAKRLHQIEVQASGLGAFEKEDVQTSLKLTDEQKKSIKESSEELRKDIMDLMQNVGQDQDKRREAFTKVRTMSQDAVNKVIEGLNADQKKEWKELTGEKFEVQFGPPRRPGNDR